jgi:peroxiredoxin
MGPESGVTGRALTTAKVPEIVLPDLDGNEVAISSLRGQKVLLVAWASW